LRAFLGNHAARAVLALAAICAVAWLGLSFRNDRLVESAEEVSANPAPPPGEVDHALADLDRAETLSFDRGTIAGLRAALHVREGRLDRAAAVAEALVREEPENADGWALLAAFARETDPARSAEARAKLRELDPVGEPARQRAEP
jgi:predicted Zn-dependent protease